MIWNDVVSEFTVEYNTNKTSLVWDPVNLIKTPSISTDEKMYERNMYAGFSGIKVEKTVCKKYIGLGLDEPV